jgi:divalent metal cation (Fe/Co/Zn/Cd) transporter
LGILKLPEESRVALKQAGRKIQYLSIAWTTLEAAVGITAGLLAGSVSLIGFGVDSIIEVGSGVVSLWRLSEHPNAEAREARAHKLIGIGFLLLAAYVSADALHDLIAGTPPRVSYFGIAYAVACMVVMPLLARAKRGVAAQLQSAALRADSHQSDLCAYLSAILLAGLALNALLGWWWADPAAALIMVPIIVREGLLALRGKGCCDDCH